MIRNFDGKGPQISESSFISEAAYIIGDVEIGDYSNVWPGAVIRGDFAKIKIGRYGSADWVVDLGPEGGAAGGEIIAAGTPEEVAASPQSPTGRYL